MTKLLACVSVYLFLAAGSVYAETLRIAVAANFAEPLKQLASAFERTTGHRVTIISGSSGKLYAQIVRGAPFDMFLSADTLKPRALVKQGIAKHLFTYARGQLVLLVSKKALTQAGTPAWVEWLNARSVKRIAIANPIVAPYGIAAQQILERFSRHTSTAHTGTLLVNAENVSQVGHYVKNYSVDAGFVAASLLPLFDGPNTALSGSLFSGHEFSDGSRSRWVDATHWWLWYIPERAYSAILQQGVILPRANIEVANAFRQFLLSTHVQTALRTDWGYLSIPDDKTTGHEPAASIQLSDDSSEVTGAMLGVTRKAHVEY